MTDFIGDEIEVQFARKAGPPTSFIWRGTTYEIAEIEQTSRALDFRKRWWRRRHRDYYLLKTETGETFQLYFHRGPGRRYWVLYKKGG